MKSHLLHALVVAGLAVLPVVSGLSRIFADEGRAPRNAAEFDTLFQQVKNWGRWGPDDQLGSGNLITPAKRKQAAPLVTTGETLSLAHPLLTEKADDAASPFEHTMLRGNTTDHYAISYHGYAH